MSVLQNRHREGKGEACREVCETTAQEGLLIAKVVLILQESITYNSSLPTTPKHLINQHSALSVDLKNNISVQIVTTITF